MTNDIRKIKAMMPAGCDIKKYDKTSDAICAVRLPRGLDWVSPTFAKLPEIKRANAFFEKDSRWELDPEDDTNRIMILWRNL